MKRAAIISKRGKPELGRIVREVTTWLRDHGYTVFADSVTCELCTGCELAEREHLVEKKPDFVIVLGGDGTLLSTARNVARSGIPILGINLGSLGFLTEVKQDEISQALADIDAGRCDLSLRSMLHCQVRRSGKIFSEHEALNDIVVHQSDVARITDFDVLVNGAFVANYKADGLIIATPTGSTAYSLAAGGPVLPPTLPGFLFTPEPPPALTNRPLVVPDGATIEISMNDTREHALLTIDGQQ